MSETRVIEYANNHKVYTVKEGPIAWADVEATQVPAKVLDAIEKLHSDWADAQAYLAAIYHPLRQTGSANVSEVEVPKCLEVASKPTSTSGSRKKKSSSATKKEASTSSSPSSEDTDA